VPEKEPLMRKLMDELYRQVCPKSTEDSVAAKHPLSPLIYGDFTNWQPVPMTEVTQFAERFYP